MNDLRTPSGLLFTILGAIVTAYGVFSPETRAPLTDANVNLYSGILFLVFGLAMLWMGKRAA